MRGAGLDIAQGEKVEAELDHMIRRADERRRLTEGERLEEALWVESAAKYNAKRQQDLRAEWCEHYRHMRGVHWSLADEYGRKLQALENGHAQDDSEARKESA